MSVNFFSQSIGRSPPPPINQSPSHHSAKSTNNPISHPVMQPAQSNQSANQSGIQPIRLSANQSNRSVYQPFNQSINQSISRSIRRYPTDIRSPNQTRRARRVALPTTSYYCVDVVFPRMLRLQDVSQPLGTGVISQVTYHTRVHYHTIDSVNMPSNRRDRFDENSDAVGLSRTLASSLRAP